jgi:hypothetical protein
MRANQLMNAIPELVFGLSIPWPAELLRPEIAGIGRIAACFERRVATG